MTASPQPLYRLAISLCLVTLLVHQGRADPYFWDATPGTALNQNGNGTWVSGGEAASANWTSTLGGAQAAWVNGNHIANLGATTNYTNNGVGGTITLGENITLNRIDKSSQAGAYIIDPGAGFKLVLTGSGLGFGNNNASAAAALTVNAVVDAGTAEVHKFNNGTVILTATNIWSGGTRITTSTTAGNNSILQIGNGGTTGTLGSGNVTFATVNTPGTAQSVLAFKRSDAVTLTQNLVSGTTDPNKGILRQAGTGTLIVASENTAFVGTAEVTSGTLQIGDGATGGALATTSGVSVSSGATLRFDRTDTTTFSAPVTGAGRLLKAGTGTLTISGTTQTYTGGTVIEAGVLQIANDDALPTNTTVTFTGAGTLDLNGFNQTVDTLTVGDNLTGTVIGADSTLTTGAVNMVVGGVAGGSSVTLDMAGLSEFVFNGPTRTLAVGGTFVSSVSATAVITSGTLRLAQNNIITALNVNVGNVNSGGVNHENTGTLLLGNTNNITATNFNIGGEVKNQGFVRFATGVTVGTVTLRGTNAEGRMNILIGRHDSNGVIVDESYFDSTAGTLDARIDTLTMGVTINRSRSALGRFSMGLGTLDATTIILGRRQSSLDSSGGAGASPTGTLELDGGLILVRTMIFADKLDSGIPGTVTGIFNFKSGTLRAITLQGGAGSTGVSRQMNWTAGSIETYDASTDLTINDVTLTLQGVGERVFNVASGRLITLNAPINNGNAAPTVAFTKRGAGTLLMGGAGSTHTGSIDIQEGIIRTTANDVLSDGATINFTESTVLDLQSNSDVVSTLTIAPGKTGTIIGANATLTLRNGPVWNIGAAAADNSTVLDMSGLGNFVFDSSVVDVNLGSQGNFANNTVTVYLAAQSNLITAKSFGLASLTAGLTSGQNVSTVYLGKANTINASTVTIGNLKSLTRLEFGSAVTDGTLKIRATNGTGRATMLIGKGQSSSVGTSALMDVSPGSLDALISTLIIGQNDNSGTQQSATTGTLIMGAGLLDATSITLGMLSNNSTNTAYIAEGILTLAGPGTVKVETLTLSQRTSTGAGFANGTFNLDGGTLQAATVQRGSAPKGTSTFNWRGGTIQNYDSSTDLSIIGVDVTITGGGARTFDVTTGRTATVNSTLVNGSTPGTDAFTKTGAGTLRLMSANTYTGSTTVQAGLLLASNSTGSATGGGNIQVQVNGTLAGTGRLAPLGSAMVLSEGTLKAGTPGSLSAGILTLDLGGTTGGLFSTGILSFDLFTNAGDNSAIVSSADRLVISQAQGLDIAINGTLQLGLGAGSTLDPMDDFAEGDRWLLIDWTGLTGGLPTINFSQIDAGEIALPSDLQWTYEYDQTGLYAVVAIVPEPGRAMLIAMGFGLALLRRKRHR